ncbi:MAG: Ig-like domain-containing protein [Thermoanaerobaculia bacterium]
MRSRRGAIGVLAAVLVAAACGRKPATLDISPKKMKIYGLERSARLTTRVLDKKGQPLDPATPNWSSSNAEVVAAEPGGRLVAKKAGSAVVTATYEDISAQVPVEVIDVSSIEISPPSLPLTGPAGTSIPLSWTVRDSNQKAIDLKPTWTSSDPKIATVSEAGVVTSVTAGTTTIVAKIGDIQGGSDVVVSLRPIGRLEIRPLTALVRAGESQHFEVIAYGPDGMAIPEAAAAFRSSNPAVATVDAAGKAEGRTAGAAIIRVELSGQFAEATLLVN